MSDFEEVPLFDVPATHERTPLPPVVVKVVVECEVMLPGELLRDSWMPEAGDGEIETVVTGYMTDGDGLADDVSDLAQDALRAGRWELIDIPQASPLGWSWERYADEIRHPTWRPIEGTP
jgi:hypothetical protein